MNGFQVVQIVCLSITLLCIPVIAYYLRKAAKLNRITAKLSSGETLSSRERRFLDRISE